MARRSMACPMGRVASRLGRLGIDALLVTEPHNVRYLTGFTGDDSALLLSPRWALLLTDGRYALQAEEEVGKLKIVTRRRGMMQTVAETVVERGVCRLGVEAAAVTVSAYRLLAHCAAGVELVETRELVESLRIVKGAHEMAHVLAAIRIADDALKAVRPKVQPGITEKRLAAELEAAMLMLGADAAAFRPIVLFGERAALPHGRPSERRLAAGDPVLIDWGALKNGYCSDLTRMLFVHRIQRLHRRLYEAVLEAQRAAFRQVKPGVVADDVDGAARGVLRRKRLAGYFTHSLGHGVGMQVHEAPAVRKGSGIKLRPGMVFTVEPGVYLPHRAGIRVEDMVLVTRSGCRALTTAPTGIDDCIVCN